MTIVGQSINRIDALGKVTGQTLYPGDIDLPGQAYMKILFANRPHAIVRSIDASRAEALEGVIAIFTAKDVPVNEYGLIMPDQPVLCGPGSSKPFADRVRFVGDQIAVIVAESEQIAAQARDLITVDFEDLPVVTDPIEAMQPDAQLLHPDHGSNIFCHYRIRKGDVQTAFSAAEVVVDGVYRTPAQEHAFLQPEAGLAYIDEAGRVTIQVAGQWTHEDQEQVAHALGLPKDQIRVIYPAIGGAFGGREDMSVQIVLALAARRLHQRGISRPVKIIWSREESIIGHHKRHPYVIRTRWGATREGKVIAAEAEVIGDGGAYAYTSTKVLGNATLMCTGPYEIPNVKVDSYAVYTNNIPNGAFRGFGGPQGAFAAETQMNRLAETLGIDPVEIRMRNVLHEGDLLSVGTPLPKGVSMPQVIEQCAEAGGWVKTTQGWKRYDDEGRTTEDEGKMMGDDGRKTKKSDQRSSISDQGTWTGDYGPPIKNQPTLSVVGPSSSDVRSSSSVVRRGTGFAAAFKNVGFSFGAPEHAWATVELHGGPEIEQVILRHAGADVGQGAHTVMAQMAAEALNVPMDRVRMVVSDTAQTGNSGSASASRMTFMSGNSILGACEKALEKWRAEERPAIGTYMYRPPATTPYDPQTGKSEPNFAYGYVAEVVRVEVDTDTGQVQILDVIATDDVGCAVNPRLVQGQIEGAVVQAVGYSVLENFVQKNGYVQTQHLSTYLIPTVLDVPEHVQSVILEYPDPIGPYGARGMAEMPFLPLAPAVIAAVHDATGVWIHEFPLTPERVLHHLRRSSNG